MNKRVTVLIIIVLVILIEGCISNKVFSDCIDTETENLQSGLGSAKGQIFVIFDDYVTFENATSIITSHNLESQEFVNYDRSKTLSVKVPSGKEAYWICKLKGIEGVEYARGDRIEKLI